MKRLKTMAVLVAALSLLTSCLKDNNDETVYYDDTAITVFTLGTLNRTLHTTNAAGNDSTYKGTVAGSGYSMLIDQAQGTISNEKLLPTGTDISKVITSVTTKNGGTVVVNLRTHDGLKDSLVVHSNTDSLDFTKPLEFRVYNMSGTAYRKYTVTLNVKASGDDSIRWEQTSPTAEELARLMSLKPVVDVTPEADGLDASADLLPTEDLNVASVALRTDATARRFVLVGNRSVETYPDDATAMVWSRIVESGEDSETYKWMFHTQEGITSANLLPRMSGLQVVSFDECLLAIGGKALGKATAEPYSCFYESLDNGLTWQQSKRYTLPTGFSCTDKCTMVTDDANLYLIVDEGKQVWVTK